MAAEISKGLEAGTSLVASKIISRQGDGRAVSEGKVVGGEVTGVGRDQIPESLRAETRNCSPFLPQ